MSALRITEMPGPDRGFKHIRRDGLVLIVPERVKQLRAQWSDDELAFRSLIVREATGEVVSVGFPKFFNLMEGEDSPETAALQRALAGDEPVWFTEKLDGSLTIRSVIDGQVVFRTRETIYGHKQVAAADAAVAYPKLLDPDFMPEVSLLFEFITPRQRIVLRYEKEELILLGAVEHSDLRMWDVPQIQAFAAEHGLPVVSLVALPRDLDGLKRRVWEMRGSEGIVARLNEGQTLIKLKSAEYLAQHRLRKFFSARHVREVCTERDIRCVADFTAYLTENHADWDLMADALPLVQAYLQAVAAADAQFDQLSAEVADKLSELPDRKSFAVQYALGLGGALTPAAFALASGDAASARRVLREAALDAAFAALQSADDERLALLDS